MPGMGARRALFRGRVATAIGLVLIASAVLAALFVPPVLLAFVILVAWLPRFDSAPGPPSLIPALVRGPSGPTADSRGPPLS